MVNNNHVSISTLASKNNLLLISTAILLTLVGELLIKMIFEIVLRIPEVQLANQSLKSETNFGVKLVFIFILAPVLETLFFQTFLIGFLQRFIPLKVCFLISALLFGISHFYTVSYIISTFYMGCIFNLVYIVFSEKKNKPTLFTALIHALRNLIALVATLFSPI